VVPGAEDAEDGARSTHSGEENNSQHKAQIRKEVIDARCVHNDDCAQVDETGVWCSDENRVAATLTNDETTGARKASTAKNEEHEHKFDFAERADVPDDSQCLRCPS
jgi:hypothetical protein